MRQLQTAQAFAAALPVQGSLLGLDISKRRIGVAGTDAERRLVTPLLVIERQKLKADVERLAALALSREAVAVIAGLPLRADGVFAKEAQAARDTATTIAAQLDLPLWLEDERYSTVEAKDRFGAGADDSHAAAVILGDALRRFAG